MSALDSSPHEGEAVVVDRPPNRGRSPRTGLRSLAAVVAPVGIGILAILTDVLIPNRQSTPSPGVFRLLLAILTVGTAGLAMLQAVDWGASRWARRNAPLIGGAIFLLLLWNLITVKGNLLPLPYFPGPQRVLASLVDDRQTLAISTLNSLRLLLCGYLTGAAAGLFCGILIGWFRPIRYWGMPLLKVIGPIPATAYVPLMMVIFPNQFLSSTALIALAVWFPMTMLTSSGIANVPLAYLDVARTLGARQGYLIFHVALPAALPNIFLGLFMGLGAAFLTLIVAETLGVSSGLGWYLKWQQGYLEYSNVYAALVIMSVFFSGLMTLLFTIRDRILKWQKGVIRW